MTTQIQNFNKILSQDTKNFDFSKIFYLEGK